MQEENRQRLIQRREEMLRAKWLEKERLSEEKLWQHFVRALDVLDLSTTYGEENWTELRKKEVKSAYRTRSRFVHPDKYLVNGGNHGDFVALGKAYKFVLSRLEAWLGESGGAEVAELGSSESSEGLVSGNVLMYLAIEDSCECCVAEDAMCVDVGAGVM